MKGMTKILAAASLAVLGAQPALAAEPAGSGATRTSAFAGVQLRLGLGETKRVAPTARLRLGLTHNSADYRSGAWARDGGGLELGLTKLGRPDLYVGGQSVRGLRQRLGLAPAATALIVVGGAAVGALAVSQMDEDLHKKQCLLPEKELCKE